MRLEDVTSLDQAMAESIPMLPQLLFRPYEVTITFDTGDILPDLYIIKLKRQFSALTP